ncbi:hypothetical protein DFH08DRAFT_217989 [Mycena albidolilacea]|uniref:RFTS domain-containing protein n=1 Tax=Mycena albidolilacea TaxID=1033008 RepID=A0AAD6ZWS3_9AGAR|nr:hypothetical protein DFH08DRAFT_217989 [Mycena albidolilacea]
MTEHPFYILVPNSRKRKASDSPSLSVSSRAPSPNPSPTKKIRGKDVAVEDTTSRLSRFALETPRCESPTVSDLGGPTLCSDDDEHSLSPDEDRTPARKDDIFEFDKETEYVGETALPDLLHERDGDGLPIRRIRDFRLFNRNNMQFITPTQLLDTDLSEGMYSASGIVDPVDVDEVDSDEDYTDEDDESPRVKSLVITGFDVHDFDECKVNKKIFIQTKRAWYILDRASPIYEPFWKPFWRQHRFAHLVITASLDEPRMTAVQFIDYLNSPNADEALTEAAFQSDEVVSLVISRID